MPSVTMRQQQVDDPDAEVFGAATGEAHLLRREGAEDA
jgi:hypothetical protein